MRSKIRRRVFLQRNTIGHNQSFSFESSSQISQFSMGKFLKRNEASSSGGAAQTASKKANSIKGLVSQPKNVLETDEGIEYWPGF